MSQPGRQAPAQGTFLSRQACIFSLLLALCAVPGNVAAELKLQNASVDILDNGLTVIVLEDRTFPVASVQMLYKVGARDETTGKTGLAHFLEHMAFRAAENFPDTGLVSSIYAVGGEWHGYTWTDQTTYFATVPKADADLLLRIEADRMSRLVISPDDIEAERGAVLAEMHMYENAPVSMLIDAVMFTAFLGHPYRNNTIGWESDIDHLQHEDVLRFYRRHYHPANAVLAVVGDVDRGQIRARVEALFGHLPALTPTPLPHTIEAPQSGERRIRVTGSADDRQFMIGYRAPSANHPDFAAFLVLQEVLGTGSGVSFLQNDWGTPVSGEARLADLPAALTTWYPPSAQDYIFIVGGSPPGGWSEARIEREIEQRMARLRSEAVSREQLAGAIESVQAELVYDVETTEDAAHQLAFFAGLGALDTLLELPQRVAAVTADDVRRVAARYLQPESRTIAWYGPGRQAPLPGGDALHEAQPSVTERPGLVPDTRPLPSPVVRRLAGGIPVIVQPSGMSRSAWLQAVLPAGKVSGATAHSPVQGYSTLAYRLQPRALERTLRQLRDDLRAVRVTQASDEATSDDPATRLEQVFAERMSTARRTTASGMAPALIVLCGNVDTNTALDLLARYFGDTAVPGVAAIARQAVEPADRIVRLGRPIAQAQLGYIVPAPAPRAADAWRLLLYIFSHDYEGRLGKEAISRRGLAYYLDSRYRSDGDAAWITLATGVDPGKVSALKALLHSELQRLAAEPPTAAELADAKAHFVGRARSGAQSNKELAQALAEQWLWYGELTTPEALAARLAPIEPGQLAGIAVDFARGSTIEIVQ